MVDLAYKGIRELILEEQIVQGALLSENQLAEYLNMSRTPVREALRRLEAEGILESIPGLGTFLRPMTENDIRHIYEVRKALELIACETAVYRITDEEIAEERAILLSLLKRHENGESIDRMEFSRIDGNLHDMLINKSDNHYIKILMDQIYFHVDRYRITSFKVSLDLVESTRQHLDLLDAFAQRNLERIKERVLSHLEWSLELLLNKLQY